MTIEPQAPEAAIADPNDPAYALILDCLKHEPPHQRGIVFSSTEAHAVILAAGGEKREQLFGSPQGLLIRDMATIKIGDWTMTAAYERPATKEEARAEFDRLLVAMDTPAEPAAEPPTEQPPASDSAP